MTRLDILSRIPPEPRKLIRSFLGNREDAILLGVDHPACQKILDSCETAIRGLLSLYFDGNELDDACRVLFPSSR
jgi:hypothetical protein